MIDRIRYILGVINFVVLPAGLLFWFMIHPWARWWRRLGPIQTYFIVVPLLVAFGVLVFWFSELLLGTEFETNWSLTAIAFILCCLMTWLEFQYWRQLRIATLVGIPELSPIGQQKDSLLKDGIYGVVRHPRYLSAGIGIVANSLFINYLGLYVLILLLVPLGYVMTLLEECELIERFGEEYREYQRQVPRFIPRWRKITGNEA